ncbi:MAG: RagB/SusD family nutrient uptake outer membrane protein [Rikenellaceae bacterium]
MKTNKICTIAALVALATSCSSDFLESTPIMSTMEDQFYQSDADMYKACVACYDPLQYEYTAITLASFAEVRSDNGSTGGGSDTDALYFQEMESFATITNNTVAQYFWEWYYTGINYCNQVINQEYTSDLAEVYKAEAKALRAWYHFTLMRIYGPCPISTTNGYGNDYPFTRNTREEVNAQIEADLLDAIDKLEVSHDATQTGRITKSAAQAILAKHYMYAADWDNDNEDTFAKAIPLLEAVMESGLYSLIDYEDNFGFLGANSAESIFEVQTCTTSNGTSSMDQIDREGTYWTMFCGPRNLANHPVYRLGWGIWVPTMDLYNFFLDDDTNRRDTCLFTIDDLDGVDNGSGTLSTWTYSGYNSIDFEGLEQRKFAIELAYISSTNTNLNLYGNQKLIRYSDIYLYLAEAYLRSSSKNEAKAKELLEELRTAHVVGGDVERRTVDEMMSEFPERFPTLLDVVWYERRCEFACEGDRWFDLVRRGIAEDVMTEFCANGRLNGQFTLNWSNTMNYISLDQTETSTCPTLSSFPDEAYE